jgi:hypothetical protein
MVVLATWVYRAVVFREVAGFVETAFRFR